MQEDTGIIHYIFDGLLATGATIMSFLVKRSIDKNDSDMLDIKKTTDDLAQDFSSYKLDSEKRFAKEETMQHSLNRIHDRLDQIVSLISHPKL